MLGPALVASLAVLSSLLGGVNAAGRLSPSRLIPGRGNHGRANTNQAALSGGSPSRANPNQATLNGANAHHQATAQGSSVLSNQAPQFNRLVYVASPFSATEILMKGGIRSTGAGHIDPNIPYAGHVYVQTQEETRMTAKAYNSDPWITTTVEKVHAWWGFGQVYKEKGEMFYIYHVESSAINDDLIQGDAKYKESISKFPLQDKWYEVHPLYNVRIPWYAIVGWDNVSPNGESHYEENKVRYSIPNIDVWGLFRS
ncbi:uncharacterized protein PgNI_01492 [Pyricularia grisea]|uniref:Enterotoxin n=1 Tax=Pyricularia grisea TaxID=148305 RepID=A0A6P8BF26_PYRGI|nr:uncharacterized protein PgNI_01492 [Pyricularia grisea]TLD15388.1 hypothetical protein PgNI_01492 [Pyricularia grisea]